MPEERKIKKNKEKNRKTHNSDEKIIVVRKMKKEFIQRMRECLIGLDVLESITADIITLKKFKRLVEKQFEPEE